MQHDYLSQKNELYGFIILYKTINVIMIIIGQCDVKHIMTSPIKQRRHFRRSHQTLSLI